MNSQASYDLQIADCVVALMLCITQGIMHLHAHQDYVKKTNYKFIMISLVIK